MAKKDEAPGPELSAALDARSRPAGLEPGFPTRVRARLPQTKPTVFESDEDSPSAIPLNPPAKGDGS